MILRTQPLVGALVNPEPTAAKRVRRAQREGVELKDRPLNVRELQRKYGQANAYAPRLLEATFALPLGTPMDRYLKRRDECVNRFILEMDKQGWDLCRDQKIQVVPGHYPAYDPIDRFAKLDEREFVVRAWFRCRAPKLIGIEVDPAWLGVQHGSV